MPVEKYSFHPSLKKGPYAAGDHHRNLRLGFQAPMNTFTTQTLHLREHHEKGKEICKIQFAVRECPLYVTPLKSQQCGHLNKV